MRSFIRALRGLIPDNIYVPAKKAVWSSVMAAALVRYRVKRSLSSLYRWPSNYRIYRKAKGSTPKMLAAAARRFAREPLLVDHVMYESYNGRDFSGNPYAIFRYLLDHPDYQHLHHVISIRDLSNPKASAYRDHPRVTLAEVNTLEFVRLQETVKYHFNDASFRDHNLKREGQVYVHGWHSTVLKKLARDTGRPWEAARVNRALLQSDFFISPNRLTTDVMFDSHGVTNFYKGEIAEFGYPRNDLTINADKDRIRQRLGILEGKKVALYAPTWRGNYKPENTVAQTLHYWAQLKLALPPEYVLVVKFHTMVYPFLSDEDRAQCVPDDLDINEVLGVTDLMVTDYSGIFYDYLCTGNPVIYFMPDKDEYLAQKDGLYLDIETLPGPICLTPKDVGRACNDLPAVREAYAARYREFVDRFVGEDDGRACERTVDLVFKGIHDGRVYRLPESEKRDILIYPSNLALNGVTSSFLALLDNIDYTSYNVAVLIPNHNKYREMQARINRKASIFYLHNEWGFDQREMRKFEDLKALGIASLDDAPVDGFRDVVRRALGDLRFECAVNFSGYNPDEASVVLFGVNADRHVIYLHNDLNKDRKIKHPQLHATFSLYRFHDDMICVSPQSRRVNDKNIGHYVGVTFGRRLGRRMRYAMNPIVVSSIMERSLEVPPSVVVDGRELSLVQRTPMISVGFPWPNNETVNFIAVGRLSPEKNHNRLIAAFAKVVTNHKNARLYVVGDGVTSSEIRTRVDFYNLHENVVMTGILPNPLGLMAACDCLVSSSDIEGQPITVLEALALGKPVIATNISGHKDLLQANEDCLVRRTVADMAEAMERFIEDRSLFRIDFDPVEYTAEAMSQFYTVVLGGEVPAVVEEPPMLMVAE